MSGRWLLTGRYFFGGGKVAADRIDRLEGLEQWVRHLSDSMASGSMPVQTIVRSADHAPPAIFDQVSRLATRLSTPRLDRNEALRRFADEIDDALGDIVVLALQRAVNTRGSERVPYVLQTLAEAVGAEVKARRAIEKERAGPRKETQAIIIVLGVFIGALVVFTKYPQVYGTVQGQVVLFDPRSHCAAGAVDDAAAVHRGAATEDSVRSAGAELMNPVVVGVIVAGALFGLAVGVVVIYWLVPQRVSLHEALTLDRTMLSAAVLEQEAILAPVTATTRTRWAGMISRLEGRLAGWRLTTPDEALALIEWTRGRFLLTRVGLTLAAVLIGPVLWLLVTIAGIPVAFAAAAGVVTAPRPGRLVRGRGVGGRAGRGPETGDAGGADLLPDPAGAVQGLR